MPTDKRLRQREGRMARQEELRLAQKQSQRRRQIAIGGGAVIVAFLIFLQLTGHLFGGNSKKVATSTPTTVALATTTVPSGPTTTTNLAVPVIAAPANAPCPKADGSSPHYTKFSAPPPTCIDATKTYTATMVTDAGTIVITLDPKAAPKTVNSFVFLAGYHFFDGIVFHRVVPGFVDQGGDPTGTGSGGPGYQFVDELPKAGSYQLGSLAMANSGPNTNGSQFFIITGPQGVQLPPNYSLFGKVTSGLDVANKINADGAADPNPPKVRHKIIKVTIAVS